MSKKLIFIAEDIVLFILKISKIFSGVSTHSKSNTRRGKKEYLDTCSALNNGMKYEDVVKYNLGDIETRMKHRDLAQRITKTDIF